MVGWLVCIAGAEKGKDFKISIREKFFRTWEKVWTLGLKEIWIYQEKIIVQLVIIPKNREFYITPGDANGLIYLSDEAVYNTRQLQSFDTLEIGESKFVFVVVCGKILIGARIKQKKVNK